MRDPAQSPYLVQPIDSGESLGGVSPMEMRPQAFNSRDLRMLNPQSYTALNQLFNRSNLSIGGRGDLVLSRNTGARGVRSNLGW